MEPVAGKAVPAASTPMHPPTHLRLAPCRFDIPFRWFHDLSVDSFAENNVSNG